MTATNSASGHGLVSTWIDDSPAHWERTTIGREFSERSEAVSDTEFRPLSVTMSGVVPQLENVAKTNNNDARKLVRIGDFAINSRSDRKGSAGISDYEGSVSVITIVITPRRMHGRYVHHLLRSSAFQEEFYRWGTGIVDDLWSTRWQAMKKIALSVPPVSEQIAIAEYLDAECARLDRLIELRLIQRHLVLERTRAAVERTTWPECIPASWVVDKLRRHTRIGNGSTPNRDTADYWADGIHPWLNSSVVNQEAVTASDQFVTDRALEECHLPMVQPGSVLVGLTGEGKTRGMATLLAIRATINQHLAYVTPRPAVWHAPYLVWSLRGAYQRLRQISDVNGSTKGGLTCAALGDLRVPRPSLEEQAIVAKNLDEVGQRATELASSLDGSIDLLRERRQALITAAVTGQIDVSTAGRVA